MPSVVFTETELIEGDLLLVVIDTETSRWHLTADCEFHILGPAVVSKDQLSPCHAHWEFLKLN